MMYINGNDSNYTSKLLDETAPEKFVMPDTASAATIAKL